METMPIPVYVQNISLAQMALRMSWIVDQEHIIMPRRTIVIFHTMLTVQLVSLIIFFVFLECLHKIAKGGSRHMLLLCAEIFVALIRYYLTIHRSDLAA